MTIEEVHAELLVILARKGDDESAHAREDRLHQAVLKTIAAGELSKEEMCELAKCALRTLEIEFARWCA